jgi:hypothetical protein
MFHSIFPSLAVAAIGLIAARMGDRLLKPTALAPCARIEKSAVVWPYAATDHTAASSCPRRAAKRVVSSSPR